MKASTLSSFVAYDLTPVEEKSAYTYNEAQLAGIQNVLAGAAEELVKAPLDEDDTSVPGIKRRAYLQGQISAMKYLLSLHDGFNSPVETQEEGDN
jgi:hypothetical protein